MDNLITFVVLVIAGLFVAYKAKTVLKKRHNRQLVSLWLFSLYLALGLFFRLEWVYLAVDARMGRHNLAWLLSAVFLTGSIYTLTANSCDFFYGRRPAWLTPGLLMALTIYLGVYAFALVNAPEHFYPGELRAVDIPSVIIHSVMLSYALATISVMAVIFGRMYRQEQTPATRFRWGAFLLSTISAWILFFVRLLLAVGGYFALWPAPIRQSFKIVALISQSLFPLWLVGYLPEPYNPARWAEYIRKLVTLRYLRTLCSCLELGHALPLIPKVGLWPQLKEPDRYLHQTLIAILDAKLSLAQRSGLTC